MVSVGGGLCFFNTINCFSKAVKLKQVKHCCLTQNQMKVKVKLEIVCRGKQLVRQTCHDETP